GSLPRAVFPHVQLPRTPALLPSHALSPPSSSSPLPPRPRHLTGPARIYFLSVLNCLNSTGSAKNGVLDRDRCKSHGSLVVRISIAISRFCLVFARVLQRVADGSTDDSESAIRKLHHFHSLGPKPLKNREYELP